MFEDLRRWLRGEYRCRCCGHTFHVMTFGFGTCVCPTCYRGEQPFVFPDRRYWLNRLLPRLGG